MYLLYRIERYLRRSRTPATRFGREAVNDPRIIFDMRNGRELRETTRARLLAHLERAEGGRA